MQQHVHRDREPLVKILRKSVRGDRRGVAAPYPAPAKTEAPSVSISSASILLGRVFVPSRSICAVRLAIWPPFCFVKPSSAVNIELHGCKREAVVFQNQNGKAVVQSSSPLASVYLRAILLLKLAPCSCVPPDSAAAAQLLLRFVQKSELRMPAPEQPATAAEWISRISAVLFSFWSLPFSFTGSLRPAQRPSAW